MFFILGADGKEYGPVAPAKIQEWMAAGRANLQSKIRRPEETEWRPLGEFPEFVTTPVPPAPAAPVLAGVPVVAVAAPVPAATLELAGRWLRLGAILLDSLIGCGAMLPGFIMLMMAGAFTPNQSAPQTALLVGGIGLFGLAFVILLAIQIYLLTTRGQTIAKKLVGIRIVTWDTEQNPGFVKAFLLRAFVNGLISSVPALGFIYSLVDALFIFRDDRRCVHDLLAGTKVVKA